MRWKKYFFVFLLGSLTSWGFAPYFGWPIVLGTSAFLFYLINKAHFKEALILGFCFGAGLGAVSMHWLTTALMIDGGRFALLCPLVWIGFGLFFGIYWATPCAISTFYP